MAKYSIITKTEKFFIGSLAACSYRIQYPVLDGAPTEFTDAINSRSYLKGKKIAFDNGSQRCEGIADSVLPDGSLLALTDSGSTAIKFGEVVAVGSD